MLNLEPRKFSRSPMSDPNCEHLNYSADPQSSQHPLCLASRAYRKDRSAIHHFFGVLLLSALPPLFRSRILRLGKAKQAQGRAATCFSALTPIARPLYATRAYTGHLQARVHARFAGSCPCSVNVFRSFCHTVNNLLFRPFGNETRRPRSRRPRSPSNAVLSRWSIKITRFTGTGTGRIIYDT